MKASHYIGRQEVLLEVSGTQDVHALQTQASRLCGQALLAQVEALFDRLAPGSDLLRIDSLELDLGNISPEKFEEEFASKLLSAIEARILEVIPTQATTEASDKVQRLSSEARTVALWIEFLETGFLANHSFATREMPAFSALLEVLQKKRSLRQVFVSSLLRSDVAAIRLRVAASMKEKIALWQLIEAPAWIWSWIETMIGQVPAGARQACVKDMVQWSLSPSPLAKGLAKTLRHWLPSLASKHSFLALEEALAQATQAPLAQEVLHILTQQDASRKAEPAAVSETDKAALPEAEQEEPKPTNSLYVPLAGLVILHNFLAPFFANLGLTTGKAFLSPETQARAVQLLGYLATGKEETAEYDLPLAKILCGMSMGTPITQPFAISEVEQSECEDLMESVIRHWAALKSSSSEALREGFFQREAKLEFRQDAWFLTVEQRAQDILLTRLPWGIGLVKLPWMPDMLHVNWT
ncbi:MAG: contractile injection system tape measure protein [Bacteroidia bacterium]|nr:contractile injection system tape measure protein [Bacteroidia bacterium]